MADSAAVRKELDDIIEEAKKSYHKLDFQTVADNYYTEDAKLMPPGKPVITGRAGIKELLASLFTDVAKWDVVNDEVDCCCENKAVVRGHYQAYDKEGKQMAAGKYLQMWKKVDGKWQLHQECWNDN